MLNVKDFPKVLVQYARTKSKVTAVLCGVDSADYIPYVNYEKGKKFGVVVAIDKDILGWSLCNKRDRFNKEKGLAIALGRAALASEMTASERFDFYNRVPDSLVDLFEEIRDRSEKYYQASYDKD